MPQIPWIRHLAQPLHDTVIEDNLPILSGRHILH